MPHLNYARTKSIPDWSTGLVLVLSVSSLYYFGQLPADTFRATHFPSPMVPLLRRSFLLSALLSVLSHYLIFRRPEPTLFWKIISVVLWPLFTAGLSVLVATLWLATVLVLPSAWYPRTVVGSAMALAISSWLPLRRSRASLPLAIASFLLSLSLSFFSAHSVLKAHGISVAPVESAWRYLTRQKDSANPPAPRGSRRK